MGKEAYGGIEGGATLTTGVLLDKNGDIIAKVTGKGTNHLLIGMDECRRRITDLVNQLKRKIGMDEDAPLKTLGLSLSGCEKEETNQILVKGLMETYPHVSERYAIGSDTEGPVAATSSNGGVTCIAGTGSNTLLINPDRTKYQCGGWGFLLGDEGSAWKIALRATKYCFDTFDGFDRAPHPIDKVWSIIKRHFAIETHLDLLDTFYTNFDKPTISAVSKKLADGGLDGDPLCRHIFEEAGMFLARALAAVVPKASRELTDREGGIHILCVGSVWLSWQLLQPGFVRYVENKTAIDEMSLMRINTSSAVGAAYMAVDKHGIDLPRDYAKNYTVFFTYKRQSRNNIVSNNNNGSNNVACNNGSTSD